MEMISSIFVSLGIDSTVFIQLGIYLFAFVVLYLLVFKDYYLASEERRKLTSGSMASAEMAEEIKRKAEEMYQKRARQINDEISLIFKDQRSLGGKEADEVLLKAQQESKKIMSTAQENVSTQIEKARGQISVISKEISGFIIEQVLNRRGNK